MTNGDLKELLLSLNKNLNGLGRILNRLIEQLKWINENLAEINKVKRGER